MIGTMTHPVVEERVELLNEMQVLHVEQAIDLKSKVKGADVKYGESTMLVEPVNGLPYVVQLPNILTRFAYTPENSGQGLLRARIQASLYFEKLQVKQ